MTKYLKLEEGLGGDAVFIAIKGLDAKKKRWGYYSKSIWISLAGLVETYEANPYYHLHLPPEQYTVTGRITRAQFQTLWNLYHSE